MTSHNGIIRALRLEYKYRWAMRLIDEDSTSLTNEGKPLTSEQYLTLIETDWPSSPEYADYLVVLAARTSLDIEDEIDSQLAQTRGDYHG